MLTLMATYPVLAYFLVVIFGLVLGSFANVVIARLPIMLAHEWQAECQASFPEAFPNPPENNQAAQKAVFNLAVPGSHCPQCQRRLRWYENIPVLSFLIQKGQCRGCQSKISVRYPLIELLTGVFFAGCLYQFGLTPLAALYALLIYVLIILTAIDATHYILPDKITLPLMWVGLIAAQQGLLPISLAAALWGAVMGYVSLWSIYWLFKLLTQKEGMGYGDFKLYAALGAWLGILNLPIVILLAACSALIWAILQKIFNRKTLDQALPFGPFLAIGALLILFFGEAISQGLGLYYL